MSFVGKKFPNLTVDAMNEMGDTFKVNVLEEAVNNKKKVVLFWLQCLRDAMCMWDSGWSAWMRFASSSRISMVSVCSSRPPEETWRVQMSFSWKVGLIMTPNGKISSWFTCVIALEPDRQSTL